MGSTKAAGHPTRVDRLSGPEWQGRVEAGAFFVSEDDGEHHDPSPFQDSLPDNF